MLTSKLITTIITFLILLTTTATVSATRTTPAAVAVEDGGYIRLPSVKSYAVTTTRLMSSSNGTEECEQTYGFLPCTTTWAGNMFLIGVYGYLMYLAATFLSDGSELLLEILGPGIVGGLFLPVLGALPDAMLILVSGISGSTSEAQSQVSVGMGLLAGSTVMLLTVIWGTCILIGKCDMDGTEAIDLTDTKGFSLLGSGVSTDTWTSYAARIMVISVLPFLVVQLPQALHSDSGRHLAVLFGLILSVLMLISYCVYQVFQPWAQERRLDYVKHKRLMTGFLKHLLQKHPVDRLFNSDGTPNHEVMEQIFKAIDQDGDTHLSKGELRAFVIGMRLEGVSLEEEDIAEKILKAFDTERHDDRIDLDEFIKGISKLFTTVRGDRSMHHNGDALEHLDRYDEESKREHLLLGEANEEGGEEIENPKKTTIKAVIFLVIGTLIAAAFADPLVDAVDNFSTATSIPSFFISFIALPLATNSSEAVSAIIFASRKKRRSASLTFSELYGAATMNNVLCLSVFLALVYVRGLSWDFSSEVLVIFLVCTIMGALGSFKTSFPLWTASIAFFLYPFSLVLVYVLDYVFGWS
uniref:Sodium/calcium exchanger protein n=1 Tax=Dianthus caryophyllus TaxID=3570 RepID=D4QD79_DIACA|nr:sodium/calcium exchanger protein [Dianthus caryophyllus]